ncbi:MAG: uroporphyrinogen-III synthase [Gammaproteobacteria bacterium]|nr:uroporphyrinogen-III synthase [Gammaproteobacteria bacterium]
MSPFPLPAVIITRPKGRADNLIQKLTDSNYAIVNMPCLEIIPVTKSNYQTYNSEINFADYSIIIFTSVNAVTGFFSLFSHDSQLSKLKVYKFYTIGKATAKKLQEYGYNIKNIIFPESSTEENSESFVKLFINLNNTNKIKNNILLIRGEESRNYISKNLLDRGFSLTEVVTYQTSCPSSCLSEEVLTSYFDHKDFIILITSISILENFYSRVKKLNNLTKILNQPLIVVSQRIVEAAVYKGFKKIYCTNSMNDVAIIGMINEIASHKSVF